MNKNKYKEVFKENDLVNEFVFLRLDGMHKRNTMAIFKCKHCSKEFRKPVHDVVSGKCKSCGCRNWLAEHSLIHGDARRGAVSQEFNIWWSMKERCNNQNNHAYNDYGGRGIRVCQRWENDFVLFLSDVGRRPSPKHTLDRFPNNDGNYEPGNVRWATKKQQSRNTRASVFVTYKGVTKNIGDWCDELGLNAALMRERIRKHKWSVEQAFETPTLPLGHTYKLYKKPSNTFISHSFGYIR